MKSTNIVTDILRVVGVGAALSLGVGVVCGLVNEQVRVTEKKKLEVHLPSNVQMHPEFKDCILVLSDEKYADIPRLERVARRCETLLQLYFSLTTADPKTVKASISSVASELEASIVHQLDQFYHDSFVPVVEHSYKRSKHFIPLNRDMKYAHEVMLQCIEGIVHDIHMMVKDKLEQKF